MAFQRSLTARQSLALGLIAEGSINISGNTVLSSTSAPYPNAMFATLSNSGSAVTVSGGALVVGSFYAPNGTTTLSGGSQIFGSIATKGYAQSGGSLLGHCRSQMMLLPRSRRLSTRRPSVCLSTEPVWSRRSSSSIQAMQRT